MHCAGSYLRNRKAFVKAAAETFDSIAIDANTRVILWEQENFQRKVLSNNIFKSKYQETTTAPFQDPEMEMNFPASVRYTV